MKHRLVLALFLAVLGSYAAARQEDYATEAVSLIRQFVKIEITGGRLTDAGWRNAGSRFFLRPEPPPTDKEILVVSDAFRVQLQTFAATANATVEASFRCHGWIKSQLRFDPWGAGAPKGVPVLGGCWTTYDLILSPWYWEHTPAGELQKPSGETRMRIAHSHFGDSADSMMLILDRKAAIRYITEMREKTTDPATRKNAAATIAALEKLKD